MLEASVLSDYLHRECTKWIKSTNILLQIDILICKGRPVSRGF